jgi:hypothetical protein
MAEHFPVLGVEPGVATAVALIEQALAPTIRLFYQHLWVLVLRL